MGASLPIAPIGPPIVLGKFIDNELKHVKFAQPVTLRFRYDDAEIPAGYAPRDLRVYYYDEVMHVWVRAGQERLDTDRKEVIVQVNHFSIYQLAANPYAAPDLSAYTEEGASPSGQYLKDHTDDVSLESGMVTVKVTDFHYPGRNGMDLVFGRILGDQDLLADDPASDHRSYYNGFGYWQPDLPRMETNELDDLADFAQDINRGSISSAAPRSRSTAKPIGSSLSTAEC